MRCSNLGVKCCEMRIAKHLGFFADDLNLVGTVNATRQRASSTEDLRSSTRRNIG